MTAPHSTYPKVMVIDDNPIDLYIATKLLKNNHFAQEIQAYNAAGKALDYLKAHCQHTESLPQVILVDIYMPEMSGFEFMEAYDLLPDSLKQNCKVYIVSSSIDSKDIVRANEDKNVIAFREKPLTKEFLDEIAAA
ncbi:response regulator [Flavobacterium sp.]|uniref:response regulator n=1 Tax=Flavobacterium sp. TaxID=239 RepID=UPI0039E21DD2